MGISRAIFFNFKRLKFHFIIPFGNWQFREKLAKCIDLIFAHCYRGFGASCAKGSPVALGLPCANRFQTSGKIRVVSGVNIGSTVRLHINIPHSLSENLVLESMRRSSSLITTNN